MWRAYAHLLISNWINQIYQTTPYHLADIGTVVFLNVSLEELESRLQDMSTRGLVIDPGATLSDLYNERMPLYQKYSQVTIDVGEQTLEQVVETICQQVG